MIKRWHGNDFKWPVRLKKHKQTTKTNQTISALLNCEPPSIIAFLSFCYKSAFILFQKRNNTSVTQNKKAMIQKEGHLVFVGQLQVVKYSCNFRNISG